MSSCGKLWKLQSHIIVLSSLSSIIPVSLVVGQSWALLYHASRTHCGRLRLHRLQQDH
jgi:hypothetical protein